MTMHAARLEALLHRDAMRWRLLGLVSDLGLPDCWIAAGFVRDALWDHLHGRPPTLPGGDVDVIWYDPARTARAEDRRREALLREAEPSIAWSVKNQARMHAHNGDAPYVSATDAMRYWPETATAVAARRTAGNRCEISAPLGLDDLFALKLRPGPAFRDRKRAVFEDRVRTKQWLARWPGLRKIDA